MVNSHGRFVWYELMTTDMEAAKAFYAKVMGWGARDASMPGMAYTLFTAGDDPGQRADGPAGGREENGRGRRAGSDMSGSTTWTLPPTRIKRLGGAVHVPPTDVPNISRFSVVADPQMATLALFKWLNPGQAAARRAGHTGPRGLARIARRRLGEGVRFLRRAFWLAKSGRRHRCDGHVSAVLRRRADDRRHVHQASDGAGSRSGFTISTSATSTRRRSA